MDASCPFFDSKLCLLTCLLSTQYSFFKTLNKYSFVTFSRHKRISSFESQDDYKSKASLSKKIVVQKQYKIMIETNDE
jgi:hypothetical protein